MASVEQLKKRLRSVELSGQLSGAMKTSASAKYAKISKRWNAYRQYAAELEAACMLPSPSNKKQKKDSHSEKNAEEKKCFLIIGHNRGLCGGYNTELHALAEQTIKKNPGSLLIVTGKSACAYLEEKNLCPDYRILLPDVPDYAACLPLIDLILDLFESEKIDVVYAICQRYENTMSQVPEVRQLLPLPSSQKSENREVLTVPDEETVTRMLWRRASAGILYSMVLEAALGAQAATLMAMKTAYENAAKTADKLKNEINKKRQGAVTAGVIETSSGTSCTEEEQYGGRR